MKFRGFVKKLSLLYAGLFAWQFLFPISSLAQVTCGDPLPLPEITDAVWDVGVDNWFGRSGVVNYFGQGVGLHPGLVYSTSCPSGCCGSYGMNFSYFLDGVEQFCGGYTCGEYMFWLPNGAHTLREDIKFFSGFPGDEERPPLNYQERNYSFSKAFNVDNDAPVIAISKPENNVTVTTGNATVDVNVSDPLSRLEIVQLTLSAQSAMANAECGFKKNLSGVDIDSSTPYESKGIYCSNRLYLASSSYCNEDMGTPTVFTRVYDLKEYVDFHNGFDCHLNFSAIAIDRVGNSTWTVGVSFIVDQQAPIIQISSWPVVLSSGPATLIAGTVLDASEIKDLKFSLAQVDRLGITTYWDGVDWGTDPSVKLSLTIPIDASIGYWSYSGLNAEKMISGSQYKLRVHSVDKFDHAGVQEKDFNYNACQSTRAAVVLAENEDIFETGAAVFRQLGVSGGKDIGHVGIYAVSDLQYFEKNGVNPDTGLPSTKTFHVNLLNKGGLLPIVDSNSDHFIVQADGDCSTLGFNCTGSVNFAGVGNFISNGDLDYWGPREDPSALRYQKEQIAYQAALQIGKPYVISIWYANWSGGNPTNPTAFRCDGLVFFANTLAGINLSEHGAFNEVNFHPPRHLALLMRPIETSKPLLSNRSITPIGEKFNLSVTAEDAESGIDRVEYFLRGGPDNPRSESLGILDTDNQVGAEYPFDCNCNPGRNLSITAVDRAANWKVYDSELNPIRESAFLKNYLVPAPTPPPFSSGRPVEIRPMSLEADWHFSDDSTPADALLAFYAVDLPFASWDGDKFANVIGGNSTGHFLVEPGNHTFYLAMMDSERNFTFQTKDFSVPKLQSPFEGNNVAIPIGDVGLVFENITKTGTFSANPTQPVQAPPGYNNSPASVAFDIHSTAEYQGGVNVSIRFNGQNLTDEDKKHLHLLHLNGNFWEDVTVGVDSLNNIIQGRSFSLSPFGVYSSAQAVPEINVTDMWPPHTSLNIDGAIFTDSSGTQYISTKNRAVLTATDDRSEPLAIRYQTDISTTEASEGLTGETINNFLPYTTGFFLTEGRRNIGYGSVDSGGNYEMLKIDNFSVDATPPMSEIHIGTITVPGGGSAYITEADSITISALDPAVSLAASGVKAIYRLVDVSPVECESAMPPAACAAAEYAAPFSLSAGTHTVYYGAVDNVGNAAAVKSVFVDVKRSKYPDPARWPYFEYLGGFGANGTGPGYFKNLRGINFDPGGNMWAADSTNSKIEVFGPGGEYLRTFTSGLIAVESFSICPDGTFWALSQITNGFYPALKKFSAAGALVREINILGSQQFRVYPRFVACDMENEPFVVGNTTADTDVVSFDASGNFKSKFPANIPYGNYQGLALGANGDVLILDSSANPNLKIKKFSQAGALLTSMPIVSSSAYSMSVDSYGNIYVPNRSYSSMEIYSSTGGLIGTFGDLPVGRQMMPIGQPRYVGVHPYSGRLYIGGTTEIKIYGPDHTPPQYTPSILSPGNGAVVYTTSPVILGLADAISQIVVYEGAALVGKTQADRYGDFSFNQAGLGAGRHLLHFQSSDAAGNLSLFSPELDITIKSMNSVQFSTPVWGPGSSEVGYSIVDTSATALGDFDRDGKTDVLGFSRNARYSFYKGNGDGTFKYVFTAQIPGMANQYSGGDDALSGDFNNDGFLDVAASVYSPNYPYSGSTLVLIYGNGDGTFQTPVTIDHLLGYAGIAKGDYNKDGYLDLASASGNSIKVYLGDPASLFLSISTSIPAELPPSSGGGITMSDIDGDGKTDIVFRNAVLFGDGFNGFDAKVILPYSYTYTADVRKALTSDFNQDGRKDIFLIAVDEALSFLNLGNRTFKKIQRTQTGGVYFYSGAAADFNGDGVADIAVSPYRLQNVYILAGHGDGTFTAPMALPTGGYSQYGHLSGTLSAEDVNGDGRNDIFQASSELGLTGGQEINTFFSFLNKTAAPDLIPPAVVFLSAENTEAGEVAVSWLATGDDGNIGRAVRYDLRYKTTVISSDIDFNGAQSVSGIASPRTSGSPERFTLSTLAGGTSYYFALKTYDEAGNVSALSNSPGIFTKYIVKATNTINGNPEISMISPVQPVITQISTVSGPGAVAIGSASAQSLGMASRMYEIKPEGIYEPPATLTFYYSTAALAEIGLTEADAAVYEYFAGTGWVKLDGQVVDMLNHRITVPITRIASLFGIFGVVKDKTAPISEFMVAGSSWTIAGHGFYINARSSISLSAFDPVVYGTSSGMAFTEFRVDAGTTTPFALYSGEFTLSTGAHKLEFRSSDNAGNIEAAKTADIIVDGEAPLTRDTVTGSSFAAGGVLYAASGSTITIISSDTASGIKELHYGVNGSTYSSSTGLAEIYLSSGGAYAVAYHAGDNVGNVGSENVVLVYVDTTTPASALSLAGSSGRGGWYLSTVDAIMGATDDSSGIRDILYSLDGSSFTSYVSSFSVLSEGTHTIKTYSLDNVLNSEIVQSRTFGVDISTPLVGYSYLPAANSENWNNTPINVLFDGTDTVSGIEYCSSSFTISSEGMGIPVSGYCADYAGWTSTVSFSVNIDTTAPASNAEIAAESGLNGWLLSPVGIALTSTDSLSGIVGLYYSVDGSSFALYSSSFAVSGEGAHSLRYYSVDRAGNKEAERELAFKLDLNSPMVSAVSGPTDNPYGWNNTAVSVVFSGTDTMSGLAYCEPEKMVETEGSSRTVTGYCSDYAGRSSTATLTVNIDTTAPNLSYAPEPLANQLGWNNSDVALKFTCSDSLSGVKSCPADILLSGEGINISTSGTGYDYAGNSGDILVSGIKIDRTAPISTAAVSGVYENGWYSSSVILILTSTDSLSGLKGIVYSLDGGGYSEYTQPVVVSSEGNHVLSYYSEDLAGNIDSAKTINFAIDATAPMVDYLLNPPANPIGWNSSPVNVLFRGSDTLSGIVDCSTATVAGEGKGQEMIGWCRDLAGNIAYATATLNIDMTRPLVSAEQAPASNASGWNNGPVGINFTGADALSGIAYCEPVKTVSVAGASQTVTGYCMDYAGLSSTVTYALSIDTVAPLLAYSRTPANTDGWNNGDVTINFDCSDDLSGIGYCPGSIMYPAEGINISTSVRAWDMAGNYKDSTVSDINIDKTAPASTAAVSGRYRNGWYSSAVEIVLGSTDAMSGVKEIYYSLDGGDYVGYKQSLSVNSDGPHEVKYYAVDKAGNIEAVGKAGFKIDLQAPAISHILNPTFNAAGWNNSAVSVVFTGTDAVSGVEECSSGNITLEGAGQEIAGWCRDIAGNISYATATINVDFTIPLVSALQTPERNAYGWNNTSVTAVFSGTDALSGIAYCSSAALLEIEGSSRTLSGYCADYAGWASTASLTVNIDTTAPNLAYIISPAANEADWNNSSVVLEFTCADGLSGVKTCPAAIPLSGEGVDISTSVAAYDYAGNLKDILVRGINIDKTQPISTVTLSGTYRNGWYSSVVSAVLSSTDSLSGVKWILYRLEGPGGTSEEKVYTVPLEFNSDGRFKLYYAAEDAAGNREVERAVEFNIDATAPMAKHTLSPVPNSKDWNNTAVQVVFSGTDTISGIELCSSETVGVEGSLQKIAGWCRDLAGNIGYSTATVNIDKTSPVISISSPAAGQIFVATRGRIYIGFGVQDNLDPAPDFGAFLVQTEDSGSPRGIRPTVIAVTNGQSIEPLDIDDGIWRLTVSATDFADNTSTLSGETFEVVHDVLAPRTGQTMAGGASLTDGVTTYITGETVLKFSSVDDLVLAEDGIGLGVKKQIVRFKAEGLVVKELAFENPEPKQGAVFNSTFTLAAASGLADGLYSLAYYAEDILGNIEGEKTLLIGLDNAAPVTTTELTGAPGENGWHISAVSVKLTANDALSGVAGIYYQSEFNGQKSELRSYTGPFTLSAEGLYNVYFYAKDRLGNTEVEKAIAFKIDSTDPLISAERNPLANTYGWNNTSVTVNYLCTDGLSGVKFCPPVAILSGEGLNQSASGEAKDNAGNSSTASISGINIDKTAPISAYRVEGIIYKAGDGKTYLSPTSRLSLSAADPVSGGAASDIDTVEYYIDSASFIVYTSSFNLNEGIRSVYYRSRDKAGNEEAARSTELHIDGTSPVTSFSISAAPYIVNGTHYINSQSAISFAAADPLTEGVASGVLITKYRLDGGAWQIYVASITIPADGLHKLDYYSLDNVQNAEVLRTLIIVVDNTAPATTMSVGEPVFEVFGLKIMTPETPVTLAASDPETAGPASGVRSIYYELTDASGQGSGIRNYTEPFTTVREGVFTVSYWSVDNAGNSGTPLEAKLRVSSLRSDALDAVDGLEMTGSADIAGTVRSNATVSLAGNARILGDVYASTISLSGKAQLTGQQHSGAATLVPVPLDMPEIVEIASNTNNNGLVPAKYLVGGRLVVPAKDELTLSTGVYYFNSIDLGGGARVGLNGKVDILVAGDISINGGASLNAAGSSSQLNIFLSTGSALTFTGGGSLAAYVYAPYSELKLAGNALLGGHYFVKRAIISGAGNILQAGEALPVAVAPPGGGPKTKATAMPSGSFGILAGPDPAFRLGEVYVFPNPAKGGEAPVFHIETGIADSVKIAIYTISGRAAHEQTLTGMPAELDDGNGLSYAYEYVWRGHIPSGVYLYYIETQKAGQKLKKTGKFSVVR